MSDSGPTPIDPSEIGALAPRPEQLLEATLLVPVRSSSGDAPDPESIRVDDFRHGADERGTRFVAAFTSPKTLAEFGPPGSDHVELRGRDLFTRADEAATPVVVDPGAATQLEIPTGLLPYLAAGIDPNQPDALRARRPVGEAPSLAAPEELPEGLARQVSEALEQLEQVERAWLLRAAEGWSAGIQLEPNSALADFDEVRNRLHAIATEQLGSRRLLAVTDLRAPALRETYEAAGPPFYVRRPPRRGLLSRLFGR